MINIINDITIKQNIESFCIKFSYCTIKDNFSIILNKNINCIEYSFYKYKINDYKWISIIKNLKQMDNLEYWIINFSRNLITNKGIIELANIISEFQNLKFLSLLIYGNNFNQKGLIKVINIISKLKNLDKLIINYFDYFNPNQFESKQAIKSNFDILKVTNKSIF